MRFAFLRATALVSTVCLLLTACAWSTAVPVVNGYGDGFVAPICYPFLVVSGAKAELFLIPNPNKFRAVQFGAFLAKNNFKVKFEKCGPVQVDADMDSTAVPLALVTLLEKLATQVPAKGLGEPISGGSTGQSFQVFEFQFTDDGHFIALRPLIQPWDFVKVHTESAKALPPDLPQNGKVTPPIPKKNGTEVPKKDGTG